MRNKSITLALAISSLFISPVVLADNDGAHVADDIGSLGVTMQALHDGDADISDVLNLIQLPEPAVSHVEIALIDHDDHDADEVNEDENNSDHDADDHGAAVSEAAQALRTLKEASDSGRDFAKHDVRETVVELARENSNHDDLSVSELSEAAHEAVHELAEAADEAAHELAEAAAEAAEESAEAAKELSDDVAEDAVEAAAELAETVAEMGEHIADQARHVVEGLE